MNSEKVRTLQWSVHPARERIGACCFALAVIGAVAWLSAELMESRWWAGLSATFLFMTLARFFLPTNYRIDEQGISAQMAGCRTVYHWTQVRRFQYDRRSGYLSTRARPSVWDGFRGISLLFRGNRDEVVAAVERNLPREAHRPGEYR